MTLVAIALGILAGIIFLIYSFYFSRILKGNPQEFETELLRALGGWMVDKGLASRRSLWLMLFLSIVIEVVYFGLALLVISNLALQFITGFMVGLEGFHLGYTIRSFSRFFKGQTTLKELFDWRLERISAIMLFTYSFLILVFLIAVRA